MDEPDQNAPGPLPQLDRQAELQRLSFNKLSALLANHDNLIFRRESDEDRGVDGSLEVKLPQGYSNMRSQVQMKSTDSVQQNNDGSISLSIETANLNYLLNGPCPMYILYDAQADRFWYVWAHEESRRLSAGNSGWRGQQTVTLRLRSALDAQAIPAVQDRIVREATLSRQTHDALANASINETVTIAIDPSSLKSINGGTAYTVLIDEGMTIVSAGYPNEAIRLMGLLSPERNQEPRIALVAAYAYFSLGQYFHARAFAASAQAGTSKLSQSDQEFLAGLIDTCDFRLGKLSADEFVRRREQREQEETGPFRLFLRLDRLRLSVHGIIDLTERARIARELEQTVDEILRDPNASSQIKLHARIERLYNQGTEHTLATIHLYFLVAMRAQMSGVRPDASNGLDQLRHQQQAWGVEANATVDEAVKSRHPLIIAQALFTRAAVCVSKLLMTKMLDCYSGQQSPVPAEYITFIESELQKVAEIYRRSGSVEGLLRTEMSLVDLYELSNRLDEAKVLTRDIVPRASAMGLAQLAFRANNLLEGKSQLQALRRDMDESKTADPDRDWINKTDARLKMDAKGLWEARGLGPERLPVIERDYFATRDSARERIEWCRHLVVLQDLTHLATTETVYKADPNRICVCAKHGWRSMTTTPDQPRVIADFKSQFCSKCSDRSPKNAA